MEYRKLGRTHIEVSTICLGTMTWGEQNTEAEAHEQLDYSLDQGVNFIDTAEMYAVPTKKETQGKTHLVRAQQVVDSDVDTVVTGCNFCFGMMNQGLGPLTPEDKAPIKVKDVADIVAENLQT